MSKQTWSSDGHAAIVPFSASMGPSRMVHLSLQGFFSSGFRFFGSSLDFCGLFNSSFVLRGFFGFGFYSAQYVTCSMPFIANGLVPVTVPTPASSRLFIAIYPLKSYWAALTFVLWFSGMCLLADRFEDFDEEEISICPVAYLLGPDSWAM